MRKGSNVKDKNKVWVVLLNNKLLSELDGMNEEKLNLGAHQLRQQSIIYPAKSKISML